MLTIRNIQSRDIQSVADTFTHIDEDYFNTLYIDHLQEKRYTLIALSTTEEGDRSYRGYASIVWESTYTQFWRRNIPEITDLYVHDNHRRQGIATSLIMQCEQSAKERGLTTIGISVEQTDTHKSIQELYQKLGYHADGFGITQHDNQLHLVKSLK